MQHRNRSLAEGARRQSRGIRDASAEILDQGRNIIPAIRERGHAERHDIEAIIEVLAEHLRRNGLLQIAGRRGHHAHIDIDIRTTANALEPLFGQHAQDFALRAERHVADFVKQQSPAMRLFKHANLHRHSGIVIFTEQFAFHLLGRDIGRVYSDEWPA